MSDLRQRLAAMLAATPQAPMDPMQSGRLNHFGQMLGDGLVGWRDEPVGGVNQPGVADPAFLRGSYQPSPGAAPAAQMPSDPAYVDFNHANQQAGLPMMGWSDEPVGGVNHPTASPEYMRGVNQPSPGILPNATPAVPPMASPAARDFNDYRGTGPSSPPEPLDPSLMQDALRGTYDDTRRFDDARSVDVAQAGDLGTFQDPTMGGDNTQTRRIITEEFNQRNSLARMDDILSAITENPDLLDANTYSGDLLRRALRVKDKLGFDLDAAQGEYLADSSRFRQTTLTHLNQYIKEITGATVGQGDETVRLMSAMPNQDDSPTEFRAKLSNAMDLTRLYVARLAHMRAEDADSMVSDGEMTGILRDRGSALYREALDRGMSAADARVYATQGLSKEFGL